MLEVGKYYAQYCYGTNDEFVFAEKIVDINEGGIGTVSFTIDEDGIDLEDAFYHERSADDYQYVEIDKTLYDELHEILGDKMQIEGPIYAEKYIPIFKELCKGHWRNYEEE